MLMRMDAALSDADGRALGADFHTKRIALRRVDAQLAARPLRREAERPGRRVFAQAEAQYAANVGAYRNALAQEHAVLEKARHELASARGGARASCCRCCRTTASRSARSRSWRRTASPGA